MSVVLLYVYEFITKFLAIGKVAYLLVMKLMP